MDPSEAALGSGLGLRLLTRQLLPNAGLVDFYNEKIDIDGVRLPRARTHFFGRWPPSRRGQRARGPGEPADGALARDKTAAASRASYPDGFRDDIYREVGHVLVGPRQHIP